MVADLRSAFAEYRDIDFNALLTDNGNGTSTLNVVELREQLIEAGYEFTDSINSLFAQIIDNYTKNISTAFTLGISGTTSATEMQAFN